MFSCSPLSFLYSKQRSNSSARLQLRLLCALALVAGTAAVCLNSLTIAAQHSNATEAERLPLGRHGLSCRHNGIDENMFGESNQVLDAIRGKCNFKVLPFASHCFPQQGSFFEGLIDERQFGTEKWTHLNDKNILCRVSYYKDYEDTCITLAVAAVLEEFAASEVLYANPSSALKLLFVSILLGLFGLACLCLYKMRAGLGGAGVGPNPQPGPAQFPVVPLPQRELDEASHFAVNIGSTHAKMY